ncbi:MAG: AMP-binding protein, partial [Bacteroidia bacterium]|nr:AMP-binding protein [Bacteroidia bacterium]
MTLPGLFTETVRNFGQRPALAFVGQAPVTYQELEKKIHSVIGLLEQLGIQPGDKVAILGISSPNWVACYYAITFMGAVAVPILPDFHETEIENILLHSESKAIFYSEGLKVKLNPSLDEVLIKRIPIESILNSGALKTSLDNNQERGPQKRYDVKGNDLAAIIYTSGTTGKSKGVMLSHQNICFTATKGSKIIPIYNTDRFLSVLPLSHAYENTVGLILPMINGACVYYLGKLPTPSVLLPALQEVKPTFMLTVPMIIEKIYRNKIMPAFNDKWILRMIYRITPIRKMLNRVAGKKLLETFGGELRFFGIGGAKLNSTIEKFLIEARFPYAIGYGLTETAPLLAGCNPQNTRLQSTGPALEEVTLKIHEPDLKTGEGEIWAKGENVMLGYYREPDLTAEMITPDGWLKT